MSQPNNQVVMPDKVAESSSGGSLAEVVVQHIQDDIEDCRSLRGWRKFFAVLLLVVAAIFYVVFFAILCLVLSNLEKYAPVLESPAISVTVVSALVVVPTLLLLVVARAVFGVKKSTNDMPYTPIQSIIHLMKEMGG